jgi:serine/threonine protein kinase
VPTSPYRWLRRLGSGSSGVVWAVERDGREFAVKVLKPHGNAAHAEAIRRECRIGPLIAQHPGVVGVRHVEEIDGVLNLEMDQVRGPSLAQVIVGRIEAKRGPLPASIAVPWMIQVLQALFWVGHKVVPQAPGSFCHRDIKPANLLMEPTGKVRVTDFGIARADVELGFLTTQTGVLKGSPRFMAPEVILERTPDGRSDQFSVGVVLFELLTGTALYVGRDVAEVLMLAVSADVEKRLALVKGPPQLVGVLRRMLARDPAKRFVNHGAAMAALGAIPVPGPPVTDLLPELMSYMPAEVEDVPLDDASGETTNPVVDLIGDASGVTDPGLIPQTQSTLTFLGPRGALPHSLHRPALQTFTPSDEGPTKPGIDPFPPFERIDEVDAFAEPDLTTDSGEELTPVVDVRPPLAPGMWGVPGNVSEDGPTVVGPSPFLDVPVATETPTAAPPRGKGPPSLPPAEAAPPVVPIGLLPAQSLRPTASEAPTEVLEGSKIEAMLAEAQAIVDEQGGSAPRKAPTPRPVQRAAKPPSVDPPSGIMSRRYEPWLIVISLLVVVVAGGAAILIAILATLINAQ